ncbi:MAG: hypothetical protein AVDCRST_MAG25-254 [uncultured Rubrobacteraceae bacterium]|uniref:Uncharacterized protein n=1 Tax=uncultured Rubrobacteraceae bacterium TaxID=349277 RepID=A0A6J4R4G7_9ACTN|nr:MAG: hypothetical protein AVDCRST_MAG25-254 [uncultured Rubrobacteraceae bacterium]
MTRASGARRCIFPLYLLDQDAGGPGEERSAGVPRPRTLS